MDKQTLLIHYSLFDNDKELMEQDRQLLDKAKEASIKAYAPYSDFRVGAAVLLDNGEIVIGNNQENAAYPQGMCAERVALFSAMAQYPDMKIISIAVYGNPQHFQMENYLAPCGGCRQVMLEYELKHKHKIRVLLGGNSGKVMLIEGIENLLPFQFSVKDIRLDS